VSIEWDSLILGSNELKTVGPATENAGYQTEKIPDFSRHKLQEICRTNANLLIKILREHHV